MWGGSHYRDKQKRKKDVAPTQDLTRSALHTTFCILHGLACGIYNPHLVKLGRGFGDNDAPGPGHALYSNRVRCLPPGVSFRNFFPLGVNLAGIYQPLRGQLAGMLSNDGLQHYATQAIRHCLVGLKVLPSRKATNTFINEKNCLLRCDFNRRLHMWAQ